MERWRAADDLEPQRLDLYLARALDLPRNRVQGWIRQGLVRLDGRLSRASALVQSGSIVEWERPSEAPTELLAESAELDLLYSDDDLWVVNKPAGLVIHPGAGVSSGTLVNRLLHLDPELARVGSSARPGIVHRLDRDTTGAIVVARTDLAYRALSDAFAERQVTKIYLALTYGRLPPRGRWQWPIGRHPHHRTQMTVHPRGRPALTEFQTIGHDDSGRLSLVALRLHTGRTHQIRVHLKAANHPLVGDRIYGEARWKGSPDLQGPLRLFTRPALHAWFLSFRHPRSGRELSIRAPIPADLEELWRRVSSSPVPSGPPDSLLEERF